MFTTVAKNFFKFLAAYFCLLVAFALRKNLTSGLFHQINIKSHKEDN